MLFLYYKPIFSHTCQNFVSLDFIKFYQQLFNPRLILYRIRLKRMSKVPIGVKALH